ncbi:MAG: 6-bladed beta-propeller [Bacteroidales bacterium]|nr:6-bladed beta-propeller [Bacteroidales bacterium]
MSRWNNRNAIIKMRQIPSIFFSTIILFSCSPREENTISETIELGGSSESISDKDLIIPIDTIILKRSTDFHIQSIKKIKEYKDAFYIFDERGYSIYKVDRTGRIISKIGERGKGKGEYLDILDFTIDSSSGNLVILSSNSNINVYSEDGSCILSKNISKSLFWSITATDWGYVCATKHKTYTSGEDAFLLYCYDKEFNLISKNIPVLPIQVHTPTFTSEDFRTKGSGVFYLDSFGLAIYSITGSKDVKKKCDIKIDNFLSKECLTSSMSFIEKQREYNWIMDWFISNDEVNITYVHDKKYCLAKYNAGKYCYNYQYNFDESDGLLPHLFDSKDENKFLSSCIIDDESDALYGIIVWQTQYK